MNQKSLGLLLHKCGQSLVKLNQIHGQAITIGLCNNQQFACKLLNAYFKLGQPLLAHSVFTQIQIPDLVSWTCLISHYLQVERPIVALSIFSQLILSGLKPDGFSMVGALSACGRMADLGSGMMVHAMIFRSGFWGSEPIVGNALIDMYGRNGRMEYAQTVFEAMKIKDVASWTSLLNGEILSGDINGIVWETSAV
ncbi:hypothetical protein U1Q18_027902 [Sarracenia purpurea var. burkii]